MPSVFISCAREQVNQARQLAKYLTARGYTILWEHDEIHAGMDFAHSIEEQIETADAVIVLWSDEAAASPFVQGEARIALQLGKLIPVKVEDFDVRGLPLDFQTYHTGELDDRPAILSAVAAKTGQRPREGSATLSRVKVGVSLPDRIPRPEFGRGNYLVWYGTNRRPFDAAYPQEGYSAERDSRVHFGKCRVYIPKSHKIGSLGSPWWKRLLTRNDDRLKLRKTVELTPKTFWHQVSSHLASVPLTERQAVVFVHGYNVSFANATLRAAQIGFDLAIKGAMAFFSWPSQGNVSGYTSDEATIEASEGAITDFMVDFATRSGADAVHIIAHSMGNRGVLRAVNRIALAAERQSRVTFGQVILAAADVDADTFRQLSAAYAQVAARTTLYVSAGDKALEASHWLHRFARAGIVPPVCIVPGIDTINVTNVDLSLLGHGYVGESRDVLQDMHRLLLSGDPPERRFGLRESQTEAGERYWVIGR